MKKLICHSGGQDSTCIILDYLDKYGAENIISLGINYGQRHFEKENAAAYRLCQKYNIERVILNIPLNETGGSPLTDKNIEMPDNLEDQKKTVVSYRNLIFTSIAASYAQTHDCDTIVLGPCIEDYRNYRDCRPVFYKLLEMVLQAGYTTPIKGSDNFIDDIVINPSLGLPNEKKDIKIETPLIAETKTETLKRILAKGWNVDNFKDSWTCYNGGGGKYNGLPCGTCPSCRERLQAFQDCGHIDPLEYWKE